MNLDISQWKEFKVSSIFTIHNGKGITKEEIEDNEGDFTVVQSGEENNGVLGKINLDYCKSMNYTLSEKPCLTVARSGSAGYVSFQLNGCVVGDSAKILLLDENIATVELYTFLQTLLTANRFKYAYGRKVTENKYMNDIVKLPIETDEEGKPIVDVSRKYSKDGYFPDWQWMENYIKSLHHKPLATRNKGTNVPQLNISSWKEFALKMLFNVELSKGDIKLDDVDRGTIPLVSSGESNNGIVGNIDEKGDGKAEIFKGNKITIDMFGNPFYQENDFYAVSHGRVNILEPKFELNKPIGLFIASIIKKEQYKFSYGRAVYSEEASNMIIKLPVQHNNDGTPYQDVNRTYSDDGYIPDWVWMENYIKSLPYGDRL